MNTKNIFKLVVSVAICEAAGIIGSFFSVYAIPTWYAALVKPSFSPPNWIFAPVWTALYLLMGISAFLIWKNGLANRAVRIALIVFIAQLLLNVLWVIIFFGIQSLGWALAEIIVLWCVIILTIILFFRISRPAAYLLIPYLFWVSFAAFLNYRIAMLNP